MARETRGATLGTQAEAPLPAGQKRKRRSPPPAGTSGNPSPVKLVLPSSASIKSSPIKPNGDETPAGEHDVKRQRISLKLKVNGTNGQAESREAETQDPDADADGDADAGGEDVVVEEPAWKGPALSAEVRAALATVIAQMAVGLPSPLDSILKLGLPPDFSDEEENTLGYLLRQSHLSWASLVETLHLFAENLLIPTAYPNPMPSLARFHTPLPRLPSQYPPNPIYTFCERLYDLMRQLKPDTDAAPGSEQWSLVQRLPASTSREFIGGDWFTSNVDPRRIEKSLEQVKNEGQEQSLLESMAGKGDKFGYATALSLQTATAGSHRPEQKMSNSMLQRASVKAKQWKDRLRAKRGGFGDVFRPVLVPPVTTFSFTPTFGPYYDSAYSSGPVGYYDSLDAMHERQRLKVWTKEVEDAVAAPLVAGYSGTEDAGAEVQEQGRTVQEILEDNGDLIAELQAWQELRVAKNQIEPTDREEVVATQLLDALSTLAGNLTPAQLLTRGVPDAHELAKRLLPVATPSIRGILDPRRPKALHDNTTVRVRPPSYAPGSSSSTSMSAQLAGGGGAQLHSSTPSTLQRPGSYPAQSPNTSSYARGPPPSNPALYQAPVYNHYGPSTPYRPPAPLGPPSGGSAGAYGRMPPGPGPSALRQSFGPGTGSPLAPGSGGIPGMYGAAGLYGLPQTMGAGPGRL